MVPAPSLACWFLFCNSLFRLPKYLDLRDRSSFKSMVGKIQHKQATELRKRSQGSPPEKKKKKK